MQRIRYRGYVIELEKGPWGWDAVIFVGKALISMLGNEYQKREDAIRDAKYVIDRGDFE